MDGGFDSPGSRPRINSSAAFSMAMTKPYPILFAPIYMQKVWGGRRLEKFGKTLPPDQQIGESWELADLAGTSASGAGGGAVHSTISTGVLRKKTIDHAVQLWGGDLLGSVRPTARGEFPLLIKFLDARENLSVQVHPSPAYAKANPTAHLKTEAWYILEAEPGAVIYKGLKPGVTRESFEAHVREAQAQAASVPGAPPAAVIDDLIAVPAIAGECHNLPSGTVHALGAGVLVAEVQTPSDTTFRLYDWGRAGREMHIEQGLACADFGPAPAATRLPEGKDQARLVRTEFFNIEEVRPNFGKVLGIGDGTSCVVIMALQGAATIRAAANTFEPVEVSKGQTILVPAAIAGAAEIKAGDDFRALIVSMG